MLFRHKAGVAGLVMAMLLASGACSHDEPTSQAAQTFEINGSTVTVQAEVTDGKVVATAADPGPIAVPGLINPGAPVKLEVEGGALKQATVSLPVDTSKLPPGVDPEAALSVLTRSPLTDNQWAWAGTGTYNATAKTLSFETEHFSEWTYAVTDFDEIRRQVALAKDKGVGFRVARTVWGNIPPLTCPEGDIPLPYAFKQPSTNLIQVCVTYNQQSHQYRVEVVNQTAMPLTVQLPPGLKAVPDTLAGTGLMGELWAKAYAEETGKTVLRGEDKTVFTADNLPHESTIIAKFEPHTFAADMASFGLDMALTSLGGYNPDLQAPNGKHSKLLPAAVRKAMDDKDFYDCMTKASNEIEDAVREHDTEGLPPDAIDAMTKISADCFGSAIEQALEQLEKQSKEGVLKRTAGWLGKRAGAIMKIPDIMEGAREEATGIMTIAWQTMGKASGVKDTSLATTVMLLPRPSLTDLPKALPQPRSKQDTRELIPVQRHLLLPSSCGINDYNWFVPYPGPYSQVAVASGVYKLSSATFYVNLMQLQPGSVAAARDYLHRLPRECRGDWVGTTEWPLYSENPGLSAGEHSRLYREMDEKGRTLDFTEMTMSGDYFIQTMYSATNRPLTDADLDAFNDELRRTVEHLDLFLPTRFKRG